MGDLVCPASYLVGFANRYREMITPPLNPGRANNRVVWEIVLSATSLIAVAP